MICKRILAAAAGVWLVAVLWGAIVFLWLPRSRTHRNRILLAKQGCEVVMEAFEMFEVDCGRYPTLAEGTSALVSNIGIQGWKGPYILTIGNPADASIVDPWGQGYRWQFPSNCLEIRSAGPDMLFDTSDDVIVRRRGVTHKGF